MTWGEKIKNESKKQTEARSQGSLAHDIKLGHFFFWPCHTACGILVAQPGIKSMPPAVEALSLNHWTTREVPGHYSLKMQVTEYFSQGKSDQTYHILERSLLFYCLHYEKARVQAGSLFHPPVVQSLSHVRLFVTPRTAACQGSLSFTISQSLLRLMFIESGMPSNHLVLCPSLLGKLKWGQN